MTFGTGALLAAGGGGTGGGSAAHAQYKPCGKPAPGVGEIGYSLERSNRYNYCLANPPPPSNPPPANPPPNPPHP